MQVFAGFVGTYRVDMKLFVLGYLLANVSDEPQNPATLNSLPSSLTAIRQISGPNPLQISGPNPQFSRQQENILFVKAGPLADLHEVESIPTIRSLRFGLK